MRRRAVGRAAIAGGAAYYAAKRGEPGQEQQADPYEAPSPEPDPMDQITELNELRAEGILTDEELSAEKKKLLGP